MNINSEMGKIGSHYYYKKPIYNTDELKYSYNAYITGCTLSFNDGVSEGITSFSKWLISNNIIPEDKMDELIKDFYGTSSNISMELKE